MDPYGPTWELGSISLGKIRLPGPTLESDRAIRFPKANQSISVGQIEGRIPLKFSKFRSVTRLGVGISKHGNAIPQPVKVISRPRQGTASNGTEPRLFIRRPPPPAVIAVENRGIRKTKWTIPEFIDPVLDHDR
jgi:hypothetical protein